MSGFSFRRLTSEDYGALQELGADAWWMASRSPELVEAMLNSPALRVYGLFLETELVASAALLTDGLTKAVLVDVVVAERYRGQGLGHEAVALTMATVPPEHEGILYCKTELAGFYETHGFRKDSSYSLMLKRQG